MEDHDQMRKATKYFILSYIPLIGSIIWSWKVSKLLEKDEAEEQRQ